MKTTASPSSFFNPRLLLALILCAVGLFFSALGFATTTSTPGWSIVTSPSSNALKAVACSSASDCWAVGSNIQHWDGTSWSIVTSPAGAASVTCASPAECWAVGSANNQTLIQRWDGTSWVIVTSPNSGTLGNFLNGVTCASASDCWAVGGFIYSDNGFPFPTYHFQSLTEHWDGAGWSVVSSPNAPDSSLAAVTCASASDCWAVGPWGISQIIEHWDGNSWAIVVSPNTGENYVSLTGVACGSSSECWAVGWYNTGGEENYELIERWDGSAWAFFPSPGTNALAGVTCTSASDCWAVGNIHFQHWDGTSWSDVTSPDTGSTGSDHLDSLACASASECWAVGYRGSTGALIEEYAPTIPPLTGVASRKIHGSAGIFDVDLPLIGTPGVECRTPGRTGTAGVDYKIVFSFVNNLTSCGTASIGSLSSGPGSNQCTVDLSGVANQQYVTVTLSNALDLQNNSGNVAATMGVLLGDVNANRLVNSTDTSQVQAQSGKPVILSNFRMDVNANGLINSTDTSTVQSQSGHGLPTPP